MLLEQLNQIREERNALQGEEDPTPHRTRISHLTDQMRTLESELEINRAREALLAQATARSRELLQQIREIRRERQSDLDLFHSWLRRVLDERQNKG